MFTWLVTLLHLDGKRSCIANYAYAHIVRFNQSTYTKDQTDNQMDYYILQTRILKSIILKSYLINIDGIYISRW